MSVNVNNQASGSCLASSSHRWTISKLNAISCDLQQQRMLIEAKTHYWTYIPHSPHTSTTYLPAYTHLLVWLVYYLHTVQLLTIYIYISSIYKQYTANTWCHPSASRSYIYPYHNMGSSAKVICTAMGLQQVVLYQNNLHMCLIQSGTKFITKHYVSVDSKDNQVVECLT